MTKYRLGRSLIFILLLLILSIFLFPIILTFIYSFLDTRELYLTIRPIQDALLREWIPFRIMPQRFTLRQYYTILIEQYTYLNMFWNSVKFSVWIAIGQVIMGTMGGFAFSKMEFKGRDILFFVYIVAMIMPFQVTMVPNYITLRILGLLNTDYAIVMPSIFAPFGIFLLRQHMRTISNSYLEAAFIDGAGGIKVFTAIIMPLSRSGIAALVVLSFVESWNMVEQPLIFLENSLSYPLSLSLSGIIEHDIGVAFASSTIYMLPMVILYFVCQDYILKGIEQSKFKE